MPPDEYTLVEKDYDSVNPHFHNSYDTVKEYATQVASFVKHFSSGKRLLNIGGTIAECSYFADFGFSVTNLDISRAMLEHIKRTDSRIGVMKGNIRDYTDQPFDAIWACRSLIHIPPRDFEVTLQNIYKLTAAGGVVGCIFFTCENDFLEEHLVEQHAEEGGIVYYRVLYNPSYLADAFRSAGFMIAKQEECADKDGEKSVYFELRR